MHNFEVLKKPNYKYNKHFCIHNFNIGENKIITCPIDYFFWTFNNYKKFEELKLNIKYLPKF